jgi:glycosyltransferase involved in cell wall biosynthesis
MNLLVFNLVMDADHPVLGHTTPLVNALARRCEQVTVITMTSGRVDVEDNVTVHSLGKERGYSEPRRLARFHRLSRRVVRDRRIDACFAHMAPLFTVLFSRQARRHRIPILLWYAHANVSRTLRLAHARADRCVSSTPEGFRLDSDKLHFLGQGIDLDRFRPAVEAPPPGIVSVGRITPIKRIDEMLQAVAILRDRGLAVPLRLFGAPHTEADRDHSRRLEAMARESGLNGEVAFEGPVPFHQVATAYHRGALSLNLSETGSIDKAILESMASGCIPVSRNAAFQAIARDHDLMELVPGEGPAAVADRIQDLLERSPEERSRLAGRLREIVARDHSLEQLADGVIDHLRELVAEQGSRAT